MTYEELIDRLKRKEPLCFLRYGDGEMKCILYPSEDKNNCDGHKYYPELGKKLKDVLDNQQENQTAIMGLQSLGDSLFPGFKSMWNINWTDSDIIHRANIKNGLKDFMDACYNILLVGNPRMIKALEYFNVDWEMVTIPIKNSFTQYEEIYKKVEQSIKNKPDRVVLFCAGMMSEPMMDSLYRDYPNTTFIDVGSALDPYAGVQSRSYHKNFKV